MPKLATKLVCQGCGLEVAADAALPFCCANRVLGDDIDHLLAYAGQGFEPGDEANPFVRFRQGSFAYAVAMEHGMTDAEFVALVGELDRKVAAVDGTGFSVTPWARVDGLGLWVKDETRNVAGSHKGRHLFGIGLFVAVAERVGLVALDSLGTAQRPFAIASCGNAALAAATIAKAMKRSLTVFIPTWADPKVILGLEALDAHIVTCERNSDAPLGDPCFHAFHAAVENGAVPFTCQGSENGLVIDGGKTLGFELAERCGDGDLHLFLQVGGGAFASATAQALEQQLASHSISPRIHAVQTISCHPVVHAWRQLAADLRDALRLGQDDESLELSPAKSPNTLADRDLALWLREHWDEATAGVVFAKATTQRSRYMRPITTGTGTPASIATGILDDETYDWFAICRAMLTTGGWPVVVTEEDLNSANELALEHTDIPVDPTGTAGLAGALVARREGQVKPDADLGVVFTGVQR